MCKTRGRGNVGIMTDLTKEDALAQMWHTAKHGTRAEKQALLNLLEEEKAKRLQKEIGIVCDEIVKRVVEE